MRPAATRRRGAPAISGNGRYLSVVNALSNDRLVRRQLARGRILDWFHIAMKFKPAENSVFGSATIDPLERDAVMTEIERSKWLVWHVKGGNRLLASKRWMPRC